MFPFKQPFLSHRNKCKFKEIFKKIVTNHNHYFSRFLVINAVTYLSRIIVSVTQGKRRIRVEGGDEFWNFIRERNSNDKTKSDECVSGDKSRIDRSKSDKSVSGIVSGIVSGGALSEKRGLITVSNHKSTIDDCLLFGYRGCKSFPFLTDPDHFRWVLGAQGTKNQ